jgi:hypothetical protein
VSGGACGELTGGWVAVARRDDKALSLPPLRDATTSRRGVLVGGERCCNLLFFAGLDRVEARAHAQFFLPSS